MRIPRPISSSSVMLALRLLFANRLRQIRTLFTSSSSLLNPALLDALRSANIHTPTWIQQAVLPHVLARRNVAFADQTGTGKTIAYLLPLLHIVKTFEEQAGIYASPGYPRSVILAPSRELAVQIADVAKMFSHHIKLSARLVIGGRPISQQKRMFNDPVDIVIATPGRLRDLIAEGHCRLSHTKLMVFDEADTLFDPKGGFLSEINDGIVRKLPADVQVVFVSATLSRPTLGRLQSRFAHVKVIESRELHKIPAALKVKFVDTGGRDKLAELAALVGDIHPSYEHVIVFCNTVDSCRAVEHGLREAGLDHITTSMHGGILPKSRRTNFDAFLCGSKHVLVATDISCRGIDLPVSTAVVMFDFPTQLTEFLHRAGRTARIGNEGVVYVLTTKRDLTAISKLKASMETGTPLDLSPHETNQPQALARPKPKQQMKALCQPKPRSRISR